MDLARDVPGMSGLPAGLEIAAGAPPALQALVLALGTLVLEDTTAITAGLLSREGIVSLPTALIGIAIGIFVGDLALYGLGAAAARGARGTAWVRRRLPESQILRLRAWFAVSGWKAITFSRFVPGSRLPIYLGAGFVGAGFGRFAFWTLVAVLLWTPIVVGGTAIVGGSIIDWARERLGAGPWVWLALTIGLIASAQLALAAIARRDSLLLWSRRRLRFEFWPTWAIYAPMAPHFAYHAIRFGFARTLTAVNPCWDDSGAVGESKQLGLDALDPAFVSPSFVVSPGDDQQAVALLDSKGWTAGWTKPVVVKPDSGCRGMGFRIVRSESEFRLVIAAAAAPVMVQRYEGGQFEVGLFYIRDPGADGRLFSICEKRFPHVTGDGRSTLGELIGADPRLQLQEDVFRSRHTQRLDEVVPAGLCVRLGHAGNHAQGCLFLDGERLRSPELEDWIVRACRSSRGFHYGRLDVQFASEADCVAGLGGVILEANGITSESTSMYDPGCGPFRAWAMMYRHWAAAFRIGAANRRNGTVGISLAEVLRRRKAWVSIAQGGSVSD